MATKKKKSSVKKVSHDTLGHHLITVRAVIALLILLLAFSVLLLFMTYQQNIVESGSFNLFMILSGVGFALLVALLFLVNPEK